MYRKKIWNQLSLKKKILFLFIPLNIISILLILILSVSMILKNGREEMIRNSSDKLLLVSEQTERILSNVTYNVKAFSTSSALQSAICDDYPDNTYGNLMFSSAMHTSVYNIMDIGSLISNGYVHTFDGRIFNIKTDEISFPTEEMKKLYTQTVNKNGQIILSSPSDKSGKSAFNISKSLIDINTGRCLGILSFDIKESLFYDAYKSICEEQEDSVILTDEDEIIISANNRLLLQTKIPDNMLNSIINKDKNQMQLDWESRRSLLMTTYAEDGNFHIIYIVGYYKLFKEAMNLALLLVFVGVLLLTVTVFVSGILAQSLILPITQLASYADEAGKGNFNAPLVICSKDEIGFLSSRFQLMSANIKQLTNRIYNEQNQKRESELKLLQAQINPHFLYNCLDNITSLITDNANDTASMMIYHLGRYYRSILSKGRNIITIQEELSLIKDYLEIQLIKTPQLFTYEISIDNECKDFKMLKMLLQPIVENSVIHGFSGYCNKNKGHITIKVTSIENTVIIIVTDNGRGMNTETISSLFLPNSLSIPKHFGLKNVQERIQLKFGPEYGLTIRSALNEETEVTVCFPKVL